MEKMESADSRGVLEAEGTGFAESLDLGIRERA